jgi:biopolymer transport protein ExbD
MEPSWLLRSSTAPLSDVVLSLPTRWIAAIPSPTHAAAPMIGGCSYSKRIDEVDPHDVLIDSDSTFVWDEYLLANRELLEDRLRMVGTLPLKRQPAVIVDSEREARYGAYVADLAAAERNADQEIGLIGEFRKQVIMAIPPSAWSID